MTRLKTSHHLHLPSFDPNYLIERLDGIPTYGPEPPDLPLSEFAFQRRDVNAKRHNAFVHSIDRKESEVSRCCFTATVHLEVAIGFEPGCPPAVDSTIVSITSVVLGSPVRRVSGVFEHVGDLCGLGQLLRVPGVFNRRVEVRPCFVEGLCASSSSISSPLSPSNEHLILPLQLHVISSPNPR